MTGPLSPIFDVGIRHGRVAAPGTPKVPPDPVISGTLIHAQLANAFSSANIDATYWAVGGGGATSYLNIIDASTPSSPTIAASVSEGTEPLLDFVSGVAAQGDYVYATGRSDNAIVVIDVSTRTSPTVVGTVQDATNLNDVQFLTVSGNYVYAGCYNSNRVTVVDVSTPSSPSVTGSVQDATNFNGPYRLVYDAGYVYVASDLGSRVTIVDVSTPASPSVTGSVTVAVQALGIAKDGNYVYTGGYGGKFVVVDVSTPASPTVVHTSAFDALYAALSDLHVLETCVHGVAYDGNAYVVIDVADPLNPVLLDSVTHGTDLLDSHGFAINGRTAVVACDNTASTVGVSVVEF